MRRSVFLSTVFCLTVLWACYTSCDRIIAPAQFRTKNTTTVGNPMAPTANKIVASICGQINLCNPQVSMESCEAGVLTATGFALPLGLAAQFDTLSSISSAESSGILTGNTSASDSCQTSIATLACTDPAVVMAYNASATNSFAQSSGILSAAAECDLAYSPNAPSFRQVQMGSSTGTQTSVATPNFAQGVENGSAMICVVFYNSGTRSVSSLTDSQNNSYIRSDATNGIGALANWTLETWYSWNISGGLAFNVTANFNNPINNEKSIICHEYTGLDTSNPGDGVSSRNFYGSDATSSSISIAPQIELLFGVAVFESSGATSGGPFTQRATFNNIVTQDRIVSSGGTYSSQFVNPPMNYISAISAYRGR